MLRQPLVWGLGERNEKEHKLINFYVANNLTTTNTFFSNIPDVFTLGLRHMKTLETKLTTSWSRIVGGVASPKSVHILVLTVDDITNYLDLTSNID